VNLRVSDRRPTSGKVPRSIPIAEIHDLFSFSRKWWKPIYPMLLSGWSNRGNLLLWSPESHFCSLQREFLRAGSPSLGLMAISALDFSSSVPPLRWSRTPVFARCPGIDSYKYLDGCCYLSQLQLSSLKLTRPTSLSTSPLSRDAILLCSRGPCDCCSVSFRWCRRCCSP